MKLVKHNSNGKKARKRKDFYWFVFGKLEVFLIFFLYIKGVWVLRSHCVLKIVILSLRVILGMMEEAQGSSSDKVPPFLTKTYNMVEDPSTDAIVSWGATDKSFIVWNKEDFEKDLLSRYFNHNNFSSFIRQLNTYVSAFNVLHFMDF